jgi:hypothetical protein
MSLVEEIAKKLDANDKDFLVSRLENQTSSSYSNLLAEQMKAASVD